MIRLILVLTLILIGVGFFRGWFQVSTQNVSDTIHVNFTIEGKKIQQDQKSAAEAANDLSQQVRDNLP
jgi:hypothetical protein